MIPAKLRLHLPHFLENTTAPWCFASAHTAAYWFGVHEKTWHLMCRAGDGPEPVPIKQVKWRYIRPTLSKLEWGHRKTAHYYRLGDLYLWNDPTLAPSYTELCRQWRASDLGRLVLESTPAEDTFDADTGGMDWDLATEAKKWFQASAHPGLDMSRYTGAEAMALKADVEMREAARTLTSHACEPLENKNGKEV